MTRDDILNMPAGYEINKLIAINVMGWALVNNHGAAGGKFWIGHGGSFGDMPERYLPDFSGEIAPAFSVVEKINLMIAENILEIENDYNYLTLECVGYTTGYAASFDCLLDHEWFENITNYKYAARADTAPLAICRAALLAVMDGVQ